MKDKSKLLMLGDSLIEWGEWNYLLPEYDVTNKGIAGEDIEGLSARINSEFETVRSPNHIFIMSGTNNLLAGNFFFPALLSSMIPRIQILSPGATLTINAILPMRTMVPEPQIIKKVNQKIRLVTESSGCSFLNMEQVFNVSCSPKAHPCFTSDGIHLSSHGYQVWAREISSHLHNLGKR